MARPQTRRFGYVDFDSMAVLPSSEDGDEFVCRRNNGDNVVVTRASIVAGVAPPFPLLAPDGSAATPSYSFAADPDVGIFRLGNNQLAFAVNGIAQFVINPTEFTAVVAGGPLLRNFDSTAIIPNIVSDSGDVNTGIGSAAADQLSLIAGAIEGIRLTELNDGVIQVPDATLGITAFAGGGQADAVALISSYNVLGTVATAADSVKLPPIFAVNSLVYVKNNGAEAADIFPATGDNLGEGVDTALSIPAGESRSFISTIANSTWTQLLPAGAAGGDVFKVGTPLDNQIGVWTGDGTIEGESGLVFDAGVLTVTGTIQAADAAGPALLNEAAATNNPTLIPDRAAPTTGIGGIAAGIITLVIAGIEGFRIDSLLDIGIKGDLLNTDAGDFGLINVAPTATVPNIVPNHIDRDTGIGRPGVDQLSLIAGALDCINIAETGGARQLAFYVTAPISLQTGVAVTDVAIHAALVALGLITA